MGSSAEDGHASKTPAHLAACAVLMLVPAILLGRNLPPERAFLPAHPAQFEPLRSEDPERAAALGRDANAWCGDALLPFAVDGARLGARLRDGTPPTWAPELGLGTDLTGGSLVPPTHPPNHLHRWLAPGRAQLAIAGLHLLLAGLGLYGLLRARGLGAVAAALGAVGLQAGGWGLVNLHLSMKVGALVALPWMLWGVERLARGRRGALLQLALAGSWSLRAGFPPLGALCWLGTGVFALLRALERPRDPDAIDPDDPTDPDRALRVLPLLGGGLAALALAAALAAPALLPMRAAAADSLRGSRAPAELALEAPPLAALGTLLAPHFLGSPTTPWAAAEDPRPAWFLRADEAPRVDAPSPLEWNLFAGVALLGLALAGAVAAPRRAAPALALLGLGLALGFALPGARELLRLPGLSAGAPTRALALGWVAWPWLAALGVQALRAGARRARIAAAATWIPAAAVGLTLAALAAPGRAADTAAALDRAALERFDVGPEELARRFPEGRGEAALLDLGADAPGLWAPALAGVVLLLLAGRGARAPRVWAVGGLLLLTGEGLHLAHTHLAPRVAPAGDPSGAQGPAAALDLAPPSEALEALARAAGDARVLRLDTSASGVADVLDLARPDLPALYGVADLTPYRVFTPAALVELVAATDPGAPFRSGLSRLSDPELLGAPVLDLLRVGAVLSREPRTHPRLEPVLERPGFHVYRRALPEPFDAVAWVVPTSAGHLALPDLASALAGGLFDPARSVSVAGEPGPLGVAPAGAARPVAHAARPAPDRLDVEVPDGPGGWLVFSEAHADGWRATLDGREVPLRRALGVLRAVAVPPGAHTVRTWYAPRHRTRGRALAALAAALLVGATVRAEVQRARRARGDRAPGG